MKKALLLLAIPLLFVAACDSKGSSNSGTTPKTDPTPSEVDPEPSTPSTPTVTTSYMTSIKPGDIYFDFNFTTSIEGFKIKVGDTEITQSGNHTLQKNQTYTVEGEPTIKYNIYAALEWSSDSGVSTNASIGTGIDAAAVTDRIARYLNSYAKFDSSYRIYFCVTDTENGWSKTIPGVDTIITKYKQV